MGQAVSFTDAPAVHGVSAPDIYRLPVVDFTYGHIIGEFTRSEVEPDIDVYGTLSIAKNSEVYVGLYPSFLLFDEVFDKGNVTIEVLDSSGNLYPSTQLPLSDTAKALALIKFTTAAIDTNYYYRLTPGSGFAHGEYHLIDTATFASGGPTLGRDDERLLASILGHKSRRRKDGERRLQTTLDGESIPGTLPLFEVYGPADQAARYTDFSIGGTPFSTVTSTIRLGFVSGGSTVDFKVTTNSSQSEVKRVLIGEDGNVKDISNLTMTNGGVDFQVSTSDTNVEFVVLKFDGETEVEVEARHAGDESNVATHSCIKKQNCPASTFAVTGLDAEELVAVQLRMRGNVNADNRAIPFVDSNSGIAYGSFRGSGSCPSNFRSSGVLFAQTTASGKAQFDIAPPTTIQNCIPELGIKATAIGINEYLGIEDLLKNYSSSARSICAHENCTTGSFEFNANNEFAGISALTMLVQGFAGSRLTLSVDSDVFYNESFDESCTDNPVVIQNLALPTPSDTQGSIAIRYELEASTVCTNRQNLVLGVLGFTEATPAPSIGPQPGAGVVGDDVPLIAGLSSAALFVVLGSLLFLFYRTSTRAVPIRSEEELAVKEDATPLEI